MKRPLALAAALPVPAARASTDAAAATMTRSALFLGTARKGGQPIADSEVSTFVDEEAVTRFPGGTTLVAASGTYGTRTSGVIHERSLLLTIVHANDPASPWPRVSYARGANNSSSIGLSLNKRLQPAEGLVPLVRDKIQILPNILERTCVQFKEVFPA